MTGFLKYHTRTFFAVTPVASNKAVALMNVTHTFNSLNIHNLAYLATINNTFKRHKKAGVPQHVTNKNKNAFFLCSFLYYAALFGYKPQRRARTGKYQCNRSE